MKIPEAKSQLPNLLIVRQDDCGVFNALVQASQCLLIGNPRIGKSMYQWRHLLFLVRPELRNLVFQMFEKQPTTGFDAINLVVRCVGERRRNFTFWIPMSCTVFRAKLVFGISIKIRHCCSGTLQTTKMQPFQVLILRCVSLPLFRLI